jgi:hypothetical protein
MLRNASLALLGLAAYVCAASPSAAPIVDLGYAKYQGTFNATANTTNFLGVRYAAPPLGMAVISLYYINH